MKILEKIRTALFVCCLNGVAPWLPLAQAQEPGVPQFDIYAYAIEGNTLLETEDIDTLLQPYRGKEKTFATVQKALEALETAYRASGYATVQVILPEQELNAGRIRLQIIEGRISNIDVEGNRHFSTDNIRSSLPGLKKGSTPKLEDIGASLRVANENASKQTQLTMRAGNNEGDIDARIAVRDESPTKAFVSLDNTGTNATGNARIGVGWQHNNVLDRDHALTMRYTTSNRPELVSIYGIGYHIPLYAQGHSLDFFAGHSDVTSGTVSGLFNVSGKGDVYGLRYNQQLLRIGALEQKLVYGFDFRVYTNNTIPLGGGTSLTPNYTVHPLSLTYDAHLAGDTHDTSFYASAAYHPRGSSDASESTFRSVRADASGTYRIFRLGAQHNRQLTGDWQLRTQIAMQHSPDALVPGEQFGIGGSTSVRGFSERELANDQGINANIELYTPDFGDQIQEGANLRGLIFIDKGHLWRNNPQPGEEETQGIASIGAGLRLGVGKNFTLKFDAARIVEEYKYQRTEAHPRVHLGLGYTF